MCFWAVIFAALYVVTLLLRIVWPSLAGYGDTLVLAAMGGACFVNFQVNRTLHCALTGPVFVVAAAVTALEDARIWLLDMALVWSIMVAAVALAFLIEWRAAPRHRPT